MEIREADLAELRPAESDTASVPGNETEAVAAASVPGKRGPTKQESEPAPAEASTGTSTEPIVTLDEVIAALDVYGAPRGGQAAGRVKMREVCGGYYVYRPEHIKPEDYAKLVTALKEAEFNSIEAAIDHLLTPYWKEKGHQSPFGREDWWKDYQGAECIGPDWALTLECEITPGGWQVPASYVRATLRPLGQPDIVWTMFYDNGRLTDVEGAGAGALADTVWRMVRLIAEGAAEGELIDRPWGWFDAEPPIFDDGYKTRERPLQ